MGWVGEWDQIWINSGSQRRLYKLTFDLTQLELQTALRQYVICPVYKYAFIHSFIHSLFSRWNWNIENLVFVEGEKNWRTWRKTLRERSKAKNRTNQDLCTCTMLGPGFQPGTMVHVLAFEWDFICYFIFITERNIFLAIFDLKEGSAKGNSYHGKLSSYGSKCYNTGEKEPRNPCSSIKEIWFTISRRENHEDRHGNYVC